MHEFKLLTAAIAATTLFVGGLAYAADHVQIPVATGGVAQQQQATTSRNVRTRTGTPIAAASIVTPRPYLLGTPN